MDYTSDRDLPHEEPVSDMSPENCIKACRAKKYDYAGTQVQMIQILHNFTYKKYIVLLIYYLSCYFTFGLHACCLYIESYIYSSMWPAAPMHTAPIYALKSTWKYISISGFYACCLQPQYSNHGAFYLRSKPCTRYYISSNWTIPCTRTYTQTHTYADTHTHTHTHKHPPPPNTPPTHTHPCIHTPLSAKLWKTKGMTYLAISHSREVISYSPEKPRFNV